MNWNGNKTCELVCAAGGGVDNRPGSETPMDRHESPDLWSRDVFGLMVLRSRREHLPDLVPYRAEGIGRDAKDSKNDLEKGCKSIPVHSRLDTGRHSPDSQPCRAFYTPVKR